MARYNFIQIGSIYLTNTGLVGGQRCKTSVAGLDHLKPAVKKHVVKAIDGTVFRQSFSGTKGYDFEIGVEWMSKTVYDSIVTLLDDSDVNDTTLAVIINGDTGDFTLTAVPNEDYATFDKFSNGIIQGVKFRMVTT